MRQFFHPVKVLVDDGGRLMATGVPFPKQFIKSVRTIFKRLFRVYAHIYYHHFADIQRGDDTEAQLNSFFKHFYLFATEFDLLDKKELAPLDDVISRIVLKNNDKQGPGR